MTDFLKKQELYSDGIIELLRADLRKIDLGSDIAVVTNGSFARREASELSDLDFYLVGTEQPTDEMRSVVCKIIEKHVPKPPSARGAFDSNCCYEQFLKNVGGVEDDNITMTKRLLLLLEGEWLYNQSCFTQLRSDLIKFYVSDAITEKQIALFLLNDIIRYYRTVCVDFNYKTVEKGKPWGIRNIKLIFSRKLFYFAGLVAVAETVNMSPDEKRTRLLELFSMSPLELLRTKFGSEFSSASDMYEIFLKGMSDLDIRKELEGVDQLESSKSDLYRHYKNLGHRFTGELYRLFKNGYEPSHPIHITVVM